MENPKWEVRLTQEGRVDWGKWTEDWEKWKRGKNSARTFGNLASVPEFFSSDPKHKFHTDSKFLLYRPWAGIFDCENPVSACAKARERESIP